MKLTNLLTFKINIGNTIKVKGVIMKTEDFNLRAKIIKETFDDHKKIVSHVKIGDLRINCNIPDDDDILINSDGDFIYLDIQQVNFTEEELVKFVEFAEETYEKYGQHISIYLLCPKNIDICVREFEIKSDSSFTIKLACINEDPCKIILDGIKEKIRANIMPDENDLQALAKLHKWCKAEERHYYLMEYIKIVNRLNY